KLNLRFEQMETFRQLNRNFNQNAWQINHNLEVLRIEMVEEMGKENPDQAKLASISRQIGELHTNLKNETIAYYLAMKSECDESQREKLNEIFMSVLQQNEDVKLPQNGRNRLNRR
ncbi:MAG: periplasmic heavy metal sensor, partial [Prolixibacteraceae bacterium]|nr:periplasmic heavy metal sensor [Prolixibacteraceae bacterium]